MKYDRVHLILVLGGKETSFLEKNSLEVVSTSIMSNAINGNSTLTSG